MGWDEYFIQIAKTVALKSKDPSTKLGVVAVNSNNSIISTGYNGFPRGADDTNKERFITPTKYEYTVHAEINLVCECARSSKSLEGSTVYINTNPSGCCTECCKAMIQAGVKRIVGVEEDLLGGRWESRCNAGSILLKECGVSVDTIKDV